MLNGAASNYHDFVIARYPDGTIAVEDVYLFSGGEMLSQTARRLWIPFIAQTLGGKGLTDEDREFINSRDTLHAIDVAFEQRQSANVVAGYRQLPKRLRENKTIILTIIMALGRGGEQARSDFLEMTELFRRLFPNDACADFMSFDAYVFKKDYEAALKAVEHIDASLGGDTYQRTLRANVLIELKRYEEARKQLDAVLEEEPALENAYWARIQLSLTEKKHAETLNWLKRWVEVCHTDVADLENLPAYADFRKSPQYGEWKKWYAEYKKK
jgi:tetratricopeptide (TPR) repeat protein